MLAEAAEMVAARQASQKTPRTYGDYREMLREKDLDIVLIATPDHWHALPMIAAVEAGADVYVQKPISVDVVEGQAMLAAARKHKRVVQVGTQRRSTPHLIEARDRIIREGKLGKVGLVEIYCYYHMRNSANPPDTDSARLPRLRHVDRPRPAAALQPDGPPAGLAGVHGIRQRHRRRHVRPHARHGRAGCSGWAGRKRVSSSRRHPASKGAKSNISDTQTATFDFGELDVVWQHRTWGAGRSTLKYPWGATIYGDNGTLKASVMGYDFTPSASGTPIHTDVEIRAGEVSRGPDREGPGTARRPGDPRAHERLARRDRRARQARGRHRGRLHLHRELHPGQPVDEARPLAEVGPRGRQGRRRRRGQPTAAAALSPAVGPPRGLEQLLGLPMLNIRQALEAADQFQRKAQDLDSAERRYREILEAVPEEPEALYRLGLLCCGGEGCGSRLSEPGRSPT